MTGSLEQGPRCRTKTRPRDQIHTLVHVESSVGVEVDRSPGVDSLQQVVQTYNMVRATKNRQKRAINKLVLDDTSSYLPTHSCNQYQNKITTTTNNLQLLLILPGHPLDQGCQSVGPLLQHFNRLTFGVSGPG